jgi:MFS family permease
MTAAVATQSTSAFSVFRNRNFSLMWMAQLVSSAGTSLTSLAGSIYVYQVTGSTLSVGLMLMATALPSLFIGLIAGVYVDRWDKRKVMIFADMMRAVIILAIPFLIPYSIVWLYILSAMAATLNQFYDPAHAALLPETASEDQLNAANAFMEISGFGAYVAGFALAGFITGTLGVEWAFYIDALTFLISATLIYFVNVSYKTPEVEDTSVAAVWQNLKEGASSIANSQVLRGLFLVFIPAFFLIGMNNTLTLPFSMSELGATEVQYGLIEAVGVVGYLLGSFGMLYYGTRIREGAWIAISYLGMGVATVIFASLYTIPPAIVVTVIAGAFNAPSVIARSTIIQRNTPREVRGRVFSAFYVTRDTVFLLGMSAAGLADVVGSRLLMYLVGFGEVAVGVATAFLPGVRQPASEWRRFIELLRTAPAAPGLPVSRPLVALEFDRLVGLQPALASLPLEMRERLYPSLAYLDAPAGTVILRQGDASDAAYFILDGRAVAGLEKDGATQVLEVMNAGDFFGEIAALTGVPRTANVVADSDTALVEVPAEVLKELAADPALNRLLMTQMKMRLDRTTLIDSARVSSMDQGVLYDLRTVGEGGEG